MISNIHRRTVNAGGVWNPRTTSECARILTMRRTKHRLSVADYSVPGTIWHVTLVTDRRRPYLADESICQLVIETFRFSCQKANANLLLFCVLPDHIHALIAIGRDDLVALMRNIKSWTTRQWSQGDQSRRMWQPSFYDTGVRKTEEIDALVGYIVNNPTRKGLVDDWIDWPWTGGSLIEEM